MSSLRDTIQETVGIQADPTVVWKVLTDLALMAQWMGEPEMKLTIQTDWIVGHPITISGFHHVKFVNRGTVLRFEPNTALAYTHLSSVSRLPDKPENYSVFEFTLTPEKSGTALALTIRNFPTETIYKHLEFYWRTTLRIIKTFAEHQNS